MKLSQWAWRWNIPEAALIELNNLFGMAVSGLPLNDSKPFSESAVQSVVRMEASEKGVKLWRNNVGATPTPQGSFIRYGLCNDTPAMNKVIKSADLIGIRPILIKPYHVGHTLGQFVSREVKVSNWRYTGTEREVAQLAWAELIMSLGGDACFTIGKGTL